MEDQPTGRNQTTTKDDGATERPKKRIRKSRSKGLRTRNGCTACRTRHVKCSEDRPRCVACEKADRECLYPLGDAGIAQATPIEHTNAQNAISTPRVEPSNLDPILTKAPALVPRTPPVATLPSIREAVLGDTTAPNEQSWTTNTGVLPEIGASPDSTWSGQLPYSAENASLKWYGLLAADATQDFHLSPTVAQHKVNDFLRGPSLAGSPAAQSQLHQPPTPKAQTPTPGTYVSQDEVSLRDDEMPIFEHFVRRLSSWIDLTDPDKHFAVVVPQMALRNWGLMSAILALSSRHLTLISSMGNVDHEATDKSVQYYNETLRYLQQAMKIVPYLRSDELLATVLTISTYEMIDGQGRGWERHLKGVFWIQRSQLIHGESQGLKKWIWWAWLRQDIWAAFKERRKILSFYTLTRECASLGFWELVNRGVFLLGQCVNYASETETEAGKYNMQARLQRADSLWASLHEWQACFAQHDRRLPTVRPAASPFTPIWIQPPAASLGVMVHHWSKLLLLEHMPALGGLKELAQRETVVQEAVDTICGIAMCEMEEAMMIEAFQCVYAAGLHVRDSVKQQAIIKMLQGMQRQTGWPHGSEVAGELTMHWMAVS